jgi:ADP-ribosylglycohydrolase
VSDDALVTVRPLLELAPNFAELLALSLDEQQEGESFASRSANGRPLGDPQFVALVERKLGGAVDWAFADDAPAYGSWGNGAPMRVAAVGWLAKTEAEADELAAAQSAVSHDHPDAIKAAQAVAGTIFALRQGRPVSDLRAWIATTYDYDLNPEIALSRGGFDVSAAGTVPGMRGRRAEAVGRRR